MKKAFVSLLALTSVFAMAGCNNNSSSGATTYDIAVVTDVGSLMDGGFNQGTYEGAKKYAEANKISYKYYQPANGDKATDNDRIAAYNSAIKNGAKVIVAPGFLQAAAMQTVANENPTVKFVFVDGWSLTKSDTDKTYLPNVTAITYKEQEAGYFAGYGAVMEGFTSLGGTFGGGGSNPACNRFSYGYVQGIEAAAAAKNLADKVDVKVSFKYGDGFSASNNLQTQISGWYSNGTDIVFSCGGSMVNSVVAAVGSNKDRYIIGVDVDQASLSDQVLTSATKGLVTSVDRVLGQLYSDKWDSLLGGKTQNLGAAEDATGLPTSAESWRFKTFTKEQYNTLFTSVKNGTVVPDGDVAAIGEEGAKKDCSTTEWWTSKLTATKYTHINFTLDK
ncbi:MAG: BMP family ABC transporter substrate-binding protein [Bacilli bacterium]